MKKCHTCGAAEMTSTRENHLYTESGLPNVVLVDVEVRRCKNCGGVEVPLPRIAELHKTIAMAVVEKRAKLTGAEVRFLRKYIGWSGDDFAQHMGVGASTVSRWENDREPIGPSSDRLLRMLVVHGAQVQSYNVDDLKRIDDAKSEGPPMKVRRRERDWALEAATG